MIAITCQILLALPASSAKPMPPSRCVLLGRFSADDFPKTLAKFVVNGYAITTADGIRRTVKGDDAANEIAAIRDRKK